MAGLESKEEDAPKRILFFKPMSWLGQIRPHRRDKVLALTINNKQSKMKPGLIVFDRLSLQ
jgi:hypothetical protein